MQSVVSQRYAVVPGYYLVCYNDEDIFYFKDLAVVPGYYLVCYNRPPKAMRINVAVVPGYYLVCYNCIFSCHLQPVL